MSSVSDYTGNVGTCSAKWLSPHVNYVTPAHHIDLRSTLQEVATPRRGRLTVTYDLFGFALCSWMFNSMVLNNEMSPAHCTMLPAHTTVQRQCMDVHDFITGSEERHPNFLDTALTRNGVDLVCWRCNNDMDWTNIWNRRCRYSLCVNILISQPHLMRANWS